MFKHDHNFPFELKQLRNDNWTHLDLTQNSLFVRTFTMMSLRDNITRNLLTFTSISSMAETQSGRKWPQSYLEIWSLISHRLSSSPDNKQSLWNQLLKDVFIKMQQLHLKFKLSIKYRTIRVVRRRSLICTLHRRVSTGKSLTRRLK